MRKRRNKYLIPVQIIDQTFEMDTGLHVCVEWKHVSKGSTGMTHAGGCIDTRFGHGCNNVTSLMLEAMVRYGKTCDRYHAGVCIRRQGITSTTNETAAVRTPRNLTALQWGFKQLNGTRPTYVHTVKQLLHIMSSLDDVELHTVEH